MKDNSALPGTVKGRKLFVRNIGFRRKDFTIKFYTEFFSKFGMVDFFDVVEDAINKLPKGYGFVTFATIEGANRALAASPDELYIPEDSRFIYVHQAASKTMALVRSSLAKLRAERIKRAKQKNLYVARLLEGSIKDHETSAKSEEEEDEDERDGIELLDDDTLLHIFSFLNVREKTICESVCRRWYNVMIYSWASTPALCLKNTFCFWSNGKALNTKTLYSILKKCYNLKALSLEQTSCFLDYKACDVISSCCPGLTKLILRNTQINKYSLNILGQNCPKLKGIDFTKCSNITEKGLWKLFDHRPDLTFICLSSVAEITGKSFYKLNALTYLDISKASRIIPEAFTKLGQNCSNTLKTLITPPLDSLGLELICNIFVNLEELQVESSGHMGVVNSPSVPIIGFRLLGKLTKLRVLRFAPPFNDLNNETFYFFTRRCPNLEEILLFCNDNLTDSSVILLPDHCKKLRYLSLEGSKLTDYSLHALSLLKNLKTLEVIASLITDDGAAYLMNHGPSLESFTVNQCLGITDRTLINAWQLVQHGLISKNFLLVYNFSRIKLKEMTTPKDLFTFEQRDFWGINDYNEAYNYNQRPPEGNILD